ncbi:hypothetical protein ABMA27_014170 [Loxostege sticticalis]|uniref:Sulfotransferase domain-containing protein n=1 Tax=Loxostege sticticalis TaxID=481309 RepID=A0ABR3ICY5_LOXSC
MPLRSDDIFVVTFPKSGTTWTQELVWLIGNDFNYEKAAAKLLTERFPFLEGSLFFNGEKAKKALLDSCNGDVVKMKILEEMSKPGYEVVEKLPSPRYIKSHLPLSLLPPSLLDTTKVVYVARDPRDVAVSYFHHNRLFTLGGFTGDFEQFWESFHKDMLDWTPYFEHLKEAWDKRNHPNMLFIFYEDLLKDLPEAVRRVAKFLNKPVNDEQLERLCNHLNFHNFKNNKSVNNEPMREFGFLAENESFIRKGKAGGWRDYFDEKMAAQAQRWIDDNLRGTDLRLPQKN